MSVRAGLWGTLLFAGLAGCSPATQHANREPLLGLCVPTFHVGQTLTLRLGPVYDANSDYVFDPSFLPGAGVGCNDVDGLTTGATVTLVLEAELPTEDVNFGGLTWDQVCAPIASFRPPSLARNSDLTYSLLDEKGVTIAAAFSETTFAGMSGYSRVALFTPSGNATAALTPRALPPLVVSRILENQRFTSACGDIWIATWVTGP